MSVQSTLTYPARIVLELAFAVANRWLTTELDNPFLWPHGETALTPQPGPRSVGPARPVHQSS